MHNGLIFLTPARIIENMIREIEQNRSAIETLCRRYRVRRLELFGSAATGTFVPATSDLDFVAEFADTQSADYADRYMDFAEALETLFRRPIDLLTPRSIRNPYFRAEVERTARLIHGPENEKLTLQPSALLESG